MKFRLGLRRSVVVVLIGLLIGGGLMAVTPAGAEVAQSAATNWKKIWKKNIRPQADKRYYTKRVSNRRYQRKGSYELAGSGYTKAESDARYAGAGSSYTKGESDARYAPTPTVIRGTFAMETTAAGAGTIVADNIPFGVTLSAAPAAHYIPNGAVPPAGCSGTAAAPSAAPGHVCVFEAFASNATNQRLFSGTGASGIASPFGVSVAATSAAGGNVFVYGSWAAAPLGLATTMAPNKAHAPSGPREGQ